MDKEVKEVLAWESLICSYINKGNYITAYILIGEKLREQAKNSQLIEDRREPITE